MNLKYSLLFVGVALSVQTANAQHASEHAHGHAHPLAPKAVASTITGKSLYNISSQWRTPEGQLVPLSSLKGSPQLLTMLYTSCSTACPMLVDKMKGVSKALTPAEREKLKMTVVSFDPKRDTPESLTRFAAKQSLDRATWTLLSPKTEEASNELAGALGVQFKKIKDDYVHSNIVFLIDKNGEIVASDEGLSKSRADFIARVKTLLNER